MLFYLTTLSLARFLIENVSNVQRNEIDEQIVSVVETWKHLDLLCQNYVLNNLRDSLYDVYNKLKTKELWESLDYKYKREDVEAKKFMAG